MKVNSVNVMPMHPTSDLFGSDLLFVCTFLSMGMLDVLWAKRVAQHILRERDVWADEWGRAGKEAGAQRSTVCPQSFSKAGSVPGCQIQPCSAGWCPQFWFMLVLLPSTKALPRIQLHWELGKWCGLQGCESGSELMKLCPRSTSTPRPDGIFTCCLTYTSPGTHSSSLLWGPLMMEKSV